LLTASSYQHANYIPQNVLNLDDKFWLSQDEENTWIQFNFKDKQISPSGYDFRNGSHCYCHPQDWKLEGSNDEKEWIKISEVRNCETFRKLNQEALFPCKFEASFRF
jgi:hypothetical protein